MAAPKRDAPGHELVLREIRVITSEITETLPMQSYQHLAGTAPDVTDP
jgi:hypothetical protein